MENNRLDIVIFGATGYTGTYAVKHAINLCKEWQLNFGIAGRNKKGLEAVAKDFALDIENIGIILADTRNEDSLEKMTKQAKVLVNCCGPYSFHGESVIQACIATHTHYVDVTAEAYFMEKMQLEYNKAAQQAGIYVVNGCGLASISSDLGITYTQKKFDGEINSIEMYLKIWLVGDMRWRGLANYTSWESLISDGFNAQAQLEQTRNMLYPKKLPEFTPKLKSRSTLFRSDASRGWSTIIPNSFDSTAYRTQRFLHDKYKQRPIQVRTYITLENFFLCLWLAIGVATGKLLARWKCILNLILQYPNIFSCGVVHREAPKSEVVTATRFSLTFKALGWSERSSKPTGVHTELPNKELITKVSSTNSGYDFTGIALILSAIMILKEADKMPDNGGVLPPGAAFGETSIIEELIKKDVKFEVISFEN